MRRIPTAVLLGAIALVLAGCGNKGPLVRPPASPDAAPAAASSAPAPAPASSASSTAPDYLSPPMPVSSASSAGYRS